MPTLNWLLESAEDRYLEATDKPAAPARDVQLECPFCSRIFVGRIRDELAKDVARHIGRDHPLRRPVLVVDGRLLGPNSTITRLPRPDDIAIENTESLKAAVDGAAPRSVSADELRAILSNAPKRMLNVRLINGRAEDNAAAAVDYRIKIDVPDPWELDDVDEAFLKHLAREDATRDDVMRFSDDTDGLANLYRDGLVSYVVGIFAKDDKSHVDDPKKLERALDNFGRAAQHLDSFADRRVAAAVAACARLNLNELNPLNAATGVTAVDLVSLFLRDLATAEDQPIWPTRPKTRASDIRCPVDEATYSLLELTFVLAEQEAAGTLDNELDRIEFGNLTSPDRAKFAVVVGEWAARHGRADAVRRCATVLYNDPVFDATVERWDGA
jgi:hypothetical protein